MSDSPKMLVGTPTTVPIAHFDHQALSVIQVFGEPPGKEAELRLTFTQCGMYALLGERLPVGDPVGETFVERVRRGREMLVRMTGVDLGYDLQAWHEHLCASDASGYRWSNKHLGFPRKIARALANPKWQRAIVQLKGGRRKHVSTDEE